MGVRHALFPSGWHWARHPEVGCQLPDAVLHGKRSVRPRSRAVPAVARAGLLSEASRLGSVAACRRHARPTGSRHAGEGSAFASEPLVSGTAAADGGTLARKDGSGLLPLRLPLNSPSGGAVFNAAGKKEGSPPCQVGPLPAPPIPLRFHPCGMDLWSLLNSRMGAACWCTGATMDPPGPCDPPGVETHRSFHSDCRSFLDHGPWSAALRQAPDVAGAGGVRPPPEGLVNAACHPALPPDRGVAATSGHPPFPGHPGLSQSAGSPADVLSKNYP